MTDALVPLCDVLGTFDAQAIRASLEARGVFAIIDGEHQRNMLGQFYLGGAVPLRIMVPRSQLRLAYQLALEIIPDLPEPRFDDESHDADGPEPMPLRRALPEDLVPYPEPDPASREGDDDDAAADDDDAAADDDEAPDSDALAETEQGDDLAEMRERRSTTMRRIGLTIVGLTALAYLLADLLLGP